MILLEDPPDPPIDPREQAFHNMIRENVIFFLIMITLYGWAYLMISAYIRRKEEFYADDEDALVYRISFWMCTFSCATSIGATLLHPFSIVTNEVLLLYPDSYYIQWLNESLVHRLWNHVFLFSNISLFVLLPFAYFFTESEGFSGSSKGIMARINETLILLLLLSVLVLGMTYLLCRILGYSESGFTSFFAMWHYLPFLYSCVSFFGVALLLVCTPVGIARLFTVLGELIVKPKFLRNVHEEYEVAILEEMDLRRKLKSVNSSFLSNSSDSSPFNAHDFSKPHHAKNLHAPHANHRQTSVVNHRLHKTHSQEEQNNIISELNNALKEAKARREELELQKRASAFRRNLGYPLAMLLLLSLTSFAALLVVKNSLELLVGLKALPSSSTEHFPLGIASLSKMGHVGAALEIILILYLWSASVVGLYTLPLFRRLRPKLRNTSFTQIVGNCGLLLVLSSALPVLARTVGITNFDLLGDFGRIEWLGNFYLVFISNSIFAVTTALALTNQFTAPVRRELYRRFKALVRWLRWPTESDSNVSLLNENGKVAKN